MIDDEALSIFIFYEIDMTTDMTDANAIEAVVTKKVEVIFKLSGFLEDVGRER